jgi:Holliday junction resolvase RusA-like endonuclease
MISVTLPLPPSVNRLYVRTRAGVVCSSRYLRWKRDAGWVIRAARVRPLVCESYDAIIYVPQRMKGDIDNRIKAILDLFVSLELVPDDRRVARVTASRSNTTLPGTCDVVLRVVALPEIKIQQGDGDG